MLLPLVLLFFIIGLFPNLFLDKINRPSSPWSRIQPLS